jgi:hypothetical protein
VENSEPKLSILIDPQEFLPKLSLLKDEMMKLRAAVQAGRDYELPERHDPIYLMFDNDFHLGQFALRTLLAAFDSLRAGLKWPSVSALVGVVSCRVVSCRVVSCRVVSCRVVCTVTWGLGCYNRAFKNCYVGHLIRGIHFTALAVAITYLKLRVPTFSTYRHRDALAGVPAVQPGDGGGGALAGGQERRRALQQCGPARGALDPARW